MINKKLVGRGGIFVVANIMNASVPLVLLPVLTRVLTPEDYGVVAMFSVCLLFISSFVGLSVHGSINVNYFKYSSRKFSEYISSCLVLLVLSAAATFFMVAMAGPLVEEYVGLPYKWMLIAVLVSFFQFLINIQLAVWMVRGEAMKYGAFQISQTVVNALVSLLLIFMAGMLWEGRLLGQTVAIIVFGVLALLVLFRSDLMKKPSDLKGDILDAVRFGVPLIPHALGAFAIYSMDRVIITNLVDVYAVGVYMVGLQLGQVVKLLADSFNKVYSPWLMGSLSGDELDKGKVVKSSYFAMFLILLVGGLWGAVATYALPVIVGQDFNQAKDIIWLMCVGFSFTGMYYIVVNYIFFSKQTKHLALITFSSGVLNVFLTYFLVKEYGVTGAAYSFVIVNSMFFIFTWFLSSRVCPMPWFAFLKGKRARGC